MKYEYNLHALWTLKMAMYGSSYFKINTQENGTSG